MPKTFKEPTTQISTRFPDSVMRDIEVIAEEEHRPFANVVIVLCREALDARRKARQGACEPAPQ